MMGILGFEFTRRAGVGILAGRKGAALYGRGDFEARGRFAISPQPATPALSPLRRLDARVTYVQVSRASRAISLENRAGSRANRANSRPNRDDPSQTALFPLRPGTVPP